MVTEDSRSAVRRVLMTQAAPALSGARLAVGDVIRCSGFQWGLRWNHEAAGTVHVAWKTHRDYHVQSGRATLADDPTRGQAPFLVHSVALTEGSGPEDVYPGNHRLSRTVLCVRLTNDFSFTSEAERVQFSLNEPMSVSQPTEASIEILGYARLPISWGAPLQ